jgi:aspartate kinase
MHVHKFGGASVKDADGFKNVSKIIESHSKQKMLIILSATGKTTNALQKVVADHYAPDADPFESLTTVKTNHYEIIKQLFDSNQLLIDEINEAFVEIEWMIEDSPHENYDFEYDQIVSVGELVSSKILAHYLHSKNLKVRWLDVRDVILTDNTYREAKVDWAETQSRIKSKTDQLFKECDIIVTQGFIGSTSENFTTTLGREGSDFTASVFSHCLDVDSMKIWKDVPGILTGDPRLFDNLTKIDAMSYREAIEMTYYGAKVLHPKTIKPIQNKGIPLQIKSFVEPEGDGTMITGIDDLVYPPIIVFEHNQCLLRIATKDFSFIAEDHLSEIFALVAKHKVKVKMMKNTAVSFIISVNNELEKVKGLVADLDENYTVFSQKDLELLTIRHYTEEIIERLTKDRIKLFVERIPKTIQMIVQPIPSLKLKKES